MISSTYNERLETFADNLNFMQWFLRETHLTAFTGYNIYARKTGIYVKVTAKNRRDPNRVRVVGKNFDWNTMETACEPWLHAQLDLLIKLLKVDNYNAKAA